MCRGIFHYECLYHSDHEAMKCKSFACKSCKQDKIQSHQKYSRRKFNFCTSTLNTSEDISFQSDHSNLSHNDDGNQNDKISTSKAILNLYRFTRHDRKKSKYESLLIVNCIDTKRTVFFDLFKQSRKLFSDPEHTMRLL